MTEYKNFIQDFPGRCRDILDIAGKPALSRGREVTLAIMVAAAGFVVPYERLTVGHPSGDSKRFVGAAEKLKLLLDQPFTSSVLSNKMSSTWYEGTVGSVNGDLDWYGLQRKPFSKEIKGRAALKVIRNGLAHGNIFTFGDPIQAIIFFEKKDFNDVGVARCYSYVYVAPRDFCQFLKNWFDFLDDVHIR